MKWPFSRKKDVSSVPAEIQEYYQTERRERTGIAWLLALGTLLLTIGLAALLFFGGRWIYRTVFDDNDDNQETAQQGSDSEENKETSNPEPAQSGSSTGTSSTSTSTPNNENSPTPNPAATGSSTQTQGATTSTPAAGDLPNTGPGDIIAVFVTVTAAGTVVSEIRRRYFA